ncbi:unnamed protein product [Fraxinus pennsylvanica]|uniref:Uncharacterized protein n=1 Tax=Fraxinus pennsylvanica TaxID=56036 RepID=A0AAD2DHJ2_9LAMI|nr:unnamed protein product [Fraxinus pennsylvanica]
MNIFCGSLSLRFDEIRCPSKRVGRSNSSLVASDVARITSYERLSESTRYESNTGCSMRRRAWSCVMKVFSFKKMIDGQTTTPRGAEKAKKRRSSWLPNPHQRWPVQGW